MIDTVHARRAPMIAVSASLRSSPDAAEALLLARGAASAESSRGDARRRLASRLDTAPPVAGGYDPTVAMTCPSCGGELMELERSGVRLDACRRCRGVWLDRGELERIVERERRVVGTIDDDEEDFVREMTGHGKPEKRYDLDAHTAERIYSDYRSHRKHKKRKSFLDELFD